MAKRKVKAKKARTVNARSRKAVKARARKATRKAAMPRKTVKVRARKLARPRRTVGRVQPKAVFKQPLTVLQDSFSSVINYFK